jgi:hypothetical protein
MRGVRGWALRSKNPVPVGIRKVVYPEGRSPGGPVMYGNFIEGCGPSGDDGPSGRDNDERAARGAAPALLYNNICHKKGPVVSLLQGLFIRLAYALSLIIYCEKGWSLF